MILSLVQINSLKEKIESMPKHQQIEVLRILKKQSKVCLNENNNGTFVNLTELEDSILEELDKYVNYIDEQQKHLSLIENEKDRLQNVFFKQDKDKERENVKI